MNVGLSGSSVSIATDYGLGGPGSNPDGNEGFSSVQTGTETHSASCKMGTASFPGVTQPVFLTTISLNEFCIHIYIHTYITYMRGPQT